MIMYDDYENEEKRKVQHNNNDNYNYYIKMGFKYVKNEYTLMEYNRKTLLEYYLVNNIEYTIFGNLVFKFIFLPALISLYIIIYVYRLFNVIYNFLFLKQIKKETK